MLVEVTAFFVSQESSSYETKNLRGMRTPRLGNMAAEATALRRESPASRTLYICPDYSSTAPAVFYCFCSTSIIWKESC